MMNTHTLQLATVPFQAIVSGTKVIESRLNDEKRQQIQIGDTLDFINREQPDRHLTATVTELLHYPTFAEMFAAQSPLHFGGPDATWLLKQINEFYSEADQAQWGVVGIKFKLD